MGYRARLGKIPKSCREQYKGLTVDRVTELIGDDCYSPYYPPQHIQLYELGKYISYGKDKEQFYDFDCYKECESEFVILTKPDLADIIETERKDIAEFYSTATDETKIQIVDNLAREWDNKFMKPYYLHEKETDGPLVSSWDRSYAIFNIVQIYRSFDWENDYLIYSAW